MFAPAFDVTPASLVSAIITERGILRAPYARIDRCGDAPTGSFTGRSEGMIIRTEAIVLRTMKYRETSRIATLYTKERGKVSVIAKGARDGKSRMGGALQPMNHVVALVYMKESRDLQLLTQCDLAGHYPGLTPTWTGWVPRWPPWSLRTPSVPPRSPTLPFSISSAPRSRPSAVQQISPETRYTTLRCSFSASSGSGRICALCAVCRKRGRHRGSRRRPYVRGGGALRGVLRKRDGP